MPVKTWVGRFAIVEAQPKEEGPFLRSFPRQRPDEAEDELYVLVDPASSGGREHTQQLAEVIGQMYQQDTLSITGAVQRALSAAHQQMTDWNERSLREHQVEAGVSCLAIRERTAYLAQIGPAVAYHLGDGRVQRIAPEAGSAEPLGQTERMQPLFSRFELSPGDLILVASPKIDEVIDQATLRSILLGGADEALVELFQLARNQREFSLVLLACVIEAETEEPPPASPTEPAAAAAPAEPSADAPSEQDTSAQAEEQPEAQAIDTQAGVPAAPEEPATAAIEPEPPPKPVAPATPSIEELTAASEREAIGGPSHLPEPRVRLKGAEAELRLMRSRGIADRLPRVPLAAVAVVIAIVAIGLVAVCVIPSVIDESRGDQFTSLVEEARVSLDSAQATVDPGIRREALNAAAANLDEAESLQPGDATVADLRSQVDLERTLLDAVVELPDLDLVVDMSERVTGAVSSRDLALGGGGAYFLDREGGRVIAVSLLGPEPEPFVMYETGDLVGSEAGGVPTEIAWAEELNSLLILDDARRLIAITPPGPGRQLAVRDAAAWGSADGIAFRNGSLYVLDRAGDQIWRYPPSEGGFDSERDALLPTFDLEQAVELAVGDAVYVVLDDGSIGAFRAGGVQPFDQAGIDQPLVSPASLTPLPGSGRILIADVGIDRIVEFALDGTYRQQFNSPSFTDLRAIAVDEPNGLLYILEGVALYRTQLPPAP